MRECMSVNARCGLRRAVELQSGLFDAADRLFHSMAATWEGVQSNMADVKELPPEFYANPDCLRAWLHPPRGCTSHCAAHRQPQH
jgi:hypothetical protein